MCLDSNILEVIHCFYFFTSKKNKIYIRFMFCLVKGIEELQHSEKQMFGFQKNIDVQHSQF